MSSTPREIGTLIVVVLRANHLPNKRHIGKQDPYCLVTVNGERRRTKAIKRGGQHPEWDEEIRFTLFEDVEDLLARTARGDATAPPPPPKDDKKTKRIKGGKTMKIACFADDPREPELIGEADVDLTEVLTKGETDDWFTLSNKDKFAGKVYIELTFWSNEPPPEKKVSHKPPKNTQYGGPGSFVPSGGPSSTQTSRIASASVLHSRQGSDVIPSSLRTSSSLAGLDLYVPPYERNQHSQMNTLTQKFNEFGVSDYLHRANLAPVPASYSQSPHAASSPYSPYGYETEAPSSYDRLLNSNAQTTAHQYSPSAPHSYPSHGYLQNPYEVNTTYQPPSRGPRHSIPTASSGFMFLPQSSGFTSLPSHTSEPSGFAPPLSLTPASMNYNSQFHPQPQQVYTPPPPPPPSHTPAPTNSNTYLQQSTSLSFHPQQPFSTSQSFSYPPYGISPSVSAPPQQYLSSPPPASVIPQAHSAPPHMYPTSPSHEDPSGQPPQSQNASRPLPQQPQVVYTQSVTPNPPPQPGDINQSNTFGPTPVPNTIPLANAFNVIPPPPPPPTILQYNANTSNVTVNAPHLPIPPPPPLPFTPNRQPVRRASLPQPPMTVDYQLKHQLPQPPPPPPPLDFITPNLLPPPPPPPLDINHTNATYYSGLPKPPAPVDEHGQWLQPTNSLSSGPHSSQGY